MKQILLLIIIIWIGLNIEATQRSFSNPAPEILIINNKTEIAVSEGEVYPDTPGTAALPMITRFFILSQGTELSSVSVEPYDIHSQQLQHPIMAVQQPIPLHSITSGSQPEIPLSHSPTEWLSRFNTYRCGSTNIAAISHYTHLYQPSGSTLLSPAGFNISWETGSAVPGHNIDNYATA
ncbi:MAG: hypothetical protein K8S56_02125 [Candidatus Cloacimonetes bacterium]|nr:hypothetical protein [Candidatus Cloacimonadota bacterium]